jgi:hypothetical protein
MASYIDIDLNLITSSKSIELEIVQSWLEG